MKKRNLEYISNKIQTQEIVIYLKTVLSPIQEVKIMIMTKFKTKIVWILIFFCLIEKKDNPKNHFIWLKGKWKILNPFNNIY